MKLASKRNYAKGSNIQKKIKLAKLTLNITPSIHAGGHERIFTSMLLGSVALSTSNFYLRNNFENGNNILLFDVRELQGLTAIIDKYLGDSQKLQNISENGQKIVMRNHTWHNRALEILEIVNMYKSLKNIKELR